MSLTSHFGEPVKQYPGPVQVQRRVRVNQAEVGCKKAAAANVESVFSGAGKFTAEVRRAPSRALPREPGEPGEPREPGGALPGLGMLFKDELGRRRKTRQLRTCSAREDEPPGALPLAPAPASA